MYDRPLYIPVILGTVRKGRMSAHVARFVLEQLRPRDGVETELIDIADLRFPIDDAGEDIKDLAFAAKMERADGLALVVPEYNHSFPGMFKHVMDTCLAEYIHKAAGVVAVSAGPFGGTRVVENLLPVLRELGLMATFTDVNFSAVRSRFDEAGTLIDRGFVERTTNFLDELIWMSTTLRYGRDCVPISGA